MVIKRATSFSLFLILAISLSLSCSSGKSPSNDQENFGVRMARMNLWREAMFRFKRAVEMNPEEATAHAVLCRKRGWANKWRKPRGCRKNRVQRRGELPSKRAQPM